MRMYTLPLGKAARAMRRVSSGTGGTSCGCSDTALLRVYQATRHGMTAPPTLTVTTVSCGVTMGTRHRKPKKGTT